MDRETLVSELIGYSRKPAEIVASLATYKWDCPTPLAWVAPKDIASILSRYVNSELSARDVEDWANAVEGRDDIGYDPSAVAGVTLHELANPALVRQLNVQRATELIGQLLDSQAELDRLANETQPKPKENAFLRWAKILVVCASTSIFLAVVAESLALVRAYLNGYQIGLGLVPVLVRSGLGHAVIMFLVMILLIKIGAPRPRPPH